MAGKAYAFFDTDAEKDVLDGAMPRIHQQAYSHDGLITLLVENPSFFRFEKNLLDFLNTPSNYNKIKSDVKNRLIRAFSDNRPLIESRYALVGEDPNLSNKKVAGELGDILNVIYMEFNIDKDVFRGDIVYEENGLYRLRDE